MFDSSAAPAPLSPFFPAQYTTMENSNGHRRSEETVHICASRANHTKAPCRHAADESIAAQPGTGIPSDLMLEYYSQRASDGGLILTEATAISAHAPGLYTDEHVAGWTRITDAVHAKGAYMFTHLW